MSFKQSRDAFRRRLEFRVMRQGKTMIPITSDYYDKLTDDDIEWLKKHAPDSFEREAIIDRMEMAKKYYREVFIPSLPESAWQA